MKKNLLKDPEFYNALTHGISMLLSIFATYKLLTKPINQVNPSATIAYLVYGLSLILLFLNSTLYHTQKESKYMHIYRRLDHSAIYILIAGTYTPYLVILFSHPLAKVALIILWLLVVAGIIYEWTLLGKMPKLSTALYLGLGWISIFLIWPIHQSIGFQGLLYLALGGISYSIGTIFYSRKQNPWTHVIYVY